MKSIWESDLEIRERSTLPQNMSVQTVIIGGGMAGILTAYFLKKQGRHAILLEAKRIGSGQTKGTTAKITSQHGLCYDKLIRKVGREVARGYALANEQAIACYEQIIKEEEIACYFEKCPAYLYTRDKAKRQALQKEAEAASSLGIRAYFVEGSEMTELAFGVEAGVCFENQAQFHPLEFIKQLSQGLEIYEDTKVLSVKGHRVTTNRGRIDAENIVFATHYPFINLPGFYFLRQHQERSYVLALKEQKKLAGIYYGIDENGLSLRSAGNVLLLGGGNHRTGKCACGSTTRGYPYLRKMAQLYYPGKEEMAAWSAQDCMPHDDIPFIGKYSFFRPYWYVATGFQKWGMTSSMIAARIISNQLCGVDEPVRMNPKVFTPQRIHFRASCVKLLIDIGESIRGLSKGMFVGKKHRCPHMGCRLEWNGQENSLDCPCHGSRFDANGELLDNPAQIDLQKKN